MKIDIHRVASMARVAPFLPDGTWVPRDPSKHDKLEGEETETKGTKRFVQMISNRRSGPNWDESGIKRAAKKIKEYLSNRDVRDIEAYGDEGTLYLEGDEDAVRRIADAMPDPGAALPHLDYYEPPDDPWTVDEAFDKVDPGRDYLKKHHLHESW